MTEPALKQQVENLRAIVALLVESADDSASRITSLEQRIDHLEQTDSAKEFS